MLTMKFLSEARLLLGDCFIAFLLCVAYKLTIFATGGKLDSKEKIICLQVVTVAVVDAQLLADVRSEAGGRI